MKILVTGGSGLIGSRFIAAYPEHEYYVLTRSPQQTRQLLRAGIKIIESLSAFTLDSFDAIINLAGEPIADKRWSSKQKQRIRESRFSITQELVDKISHCDNPPKVFLSGSAIGYYGAQGATELTEENPGSPSENFSHQLCKEWEDIAMQAADRSRVVLLRTGIVLAKEQGALAKMLLPFKLGLGGKVSNGEQFMSWIHIDDMVAAIHYLLLNESEKGPYNLVAPNPTSNKEFTKTLASSLQRKALFTIPAFVLRLTMGESASLLLDSTKVLPEKLLGSGFKFKYQKLDNALNELLSNDKS